MKEDVTKKPAPANPILALREAGQSVWLDYIHRGLLRSGELRRLAEDGVAGVTSNPTIFDKAISGSADYDDAIAPLAAEGKSVQEIYEALIADDIREATDILRPVFDRTGGLDGYVSVEVSPLLAHDTAATIQEVRRWMAVISRPNLMVKIPATPEGIPAIEEMIAEGRNINITLLFSRRMYERVIEAYLRGLERRAADGRPVEAIASVASFFVSRIDTEADKRLDAQIKSASDPRAAEARRRLLGRAAVANAKLAYRTCREVFDGPRFKALAGKGARIQRLLWGSTSTKNPAYSDLHYVEPLIGPDTINTLPPQTIAALRDHGRVVPGTVMHGLHDAEAVMVGLAAVGISIDDVTQTVLDQGVVLFADSFRQLLATIESRRAGVAGAASAPRDRR